MSYNNGTNRLGGNLGVATGYHADIAMELNGANVLFRTSDDSGATWTTFWTQSIATFVTVSPATVVLIAEDWFNTATAGSEVVAEFNPSSGAPTPTISAITPISGPIGTEITITGTNLSGATGATIGGSIALIGVVVDSATQVRGTTQSGSPASGTIQVTTPGGTAIGPTFTITPIFTDLVVTNPNSIYVVGVLLSAITVRARDQFGNTYLGALAVCTVSSLSLPLTVVGTLTAAFVSGVATFSNLTPSAGAAPPTITSFTPGFGMVGSSVLITGTNLLGVTSVTLGTLPCAFTVGSDTQITAVVPVGAT